MKLPYADIHTHNRLAGPDALINLEPEADVPASGSFSIGVHPWRTADADVDALWALVEQKAALPQIKAIGEAGLDALRGAPIDEQELLFARHVALSERLGKPLIIHAVRSLHHILRLRKELRPQQPWIIHGFRGKWPLAKQLLDAGCDISLGKIFDPEVLRLTPPDRLYRETDV